MNSSSRTLFRLVLSTSIVLAASLFQTSCGNTAEKTTPIKKGAGSGSGDGGGEQKPDNNAIKSALADSVLLQFFDTTPDRSSELSAVTATAARFSALFRVNNRSMATSWKHGFSLKKGESLDFIKATEDVDLHDDKLSLSVSATRFDKDKTAEDLGYLVLNYQLVRTDPEVGDPKKSYLLVLIDLNHPKSGKAILKNEVIYPVKSDFDLKVWIDRQLKSH